MHTHPQAGCLRPARVIQAQTFRQRSGKAAHISVGCTLSLWARGPMAQAVRGSHAHTMIRQFWRQVADLAFYCKFAGLQG